MALIAVNIGIYDWNILENGAPNEVPDDLPNGGKPELMEVIHALN